MRKDLICPFCKKSVNYLDSIDSSIAYGITNEGFILSISMHCSHCNKNFGVKCEIIEVDPYEIRFDPAILESKIEDINKQFKVKKCLNCSKVLTKNRIKMGSNFCSKKCDREVTKARLFDS